MLNMITFVLAMSASLFTQWVPTPQQQVRQGQEKLRQIFLNHPEPLVREKLWGWLGSGKVQFAAHNMPQIPETIVSQEELPNGQKQILLWYNMNFLLNVPLVPPSDKEDYLRLVFYHEAVHIDDSISGRLILGPVVPKVRMSLDQMAQKTWDSEWSAVSKEWALAKKIGKPHLVPVIYAATKNGENPLSFLDGFYQLQMSGVATTITPELGVGFTIRYKKELAKLKR